MSEIQITFESGDSVDIDAELLHLTCPQCAMVFPIDTSGHSAQSDADAYAEHLEAHAARTRANDGISDAVVE